MMTVRLIAHTPEPEKVVAAAAKLCYSDAHITDLLDGLTEEKTAKFLTMLSDLGHASPIEHASFTFGIEGVSRTLLAQITRHRIASFSVQSQRYVRLDDFRYVVPPEIEAIPEAKEAFLASMEEDAKRYLDLAHKLEEGHTARLMAEGMPEKQARAKASKQANEDARFVLPNACETKMVVTMNARSLQNFSTCAAAAAPSGRSGSWPKNVRAGVSGGTAYLCKVRPGLCIRPLPGRQDVLRQNRRGACKICIHQGGCRRMSKGKLIVLEGLDGSGKATQAKLLAAHLKEQGFSVREITFPNYESDSSALVKMYLAGQFGQHPDDVNAYAASSFYAVDRYASYKKDWGNFYENGGIIIADRYTTSNAVHQCSKLPPEQWESFLGWLFDFEFHLLGLPAPDEVIYLQVDPAVSQKLMTQRYHGDESRKDVHEKDTEYLARSRCAAEYCAAHLGWAVVHCTSGDNMRSIEDIQAEVQEIVLKQLT